MPLREDILAPISGDQPGGVDLRYHPIYDQLKEARREDELVDQGVWQRERKAADWNLVLKLASEALAKKSKDLQIASWLGEALIRKEGLPGAKEAFDLCTGLLNQFWDVLYPELEDGDAEWRSVPLSWLVSRAVEGVGSVSVAAPGLTWIEYRDALTVPTEEEGASGDPAKAERRQDALAQGKTTPEQLAEALKATPSAFLEERAQQLAAAREAMEALEQCCQEKFGEYAPNFNPLRDRMDEFGVALRVLTQRKKEEGKPPAAGKRQEQARSTAETAEPQSASGDNWWENFSPEPIETTEEEHGQEYESSGGQDYGTATEETPPSSDSWDRSPSWESSYASAVAEPPSTQAAEPSSAEDCAHRLQMIAAWLRRQDPTNPASYLMLRGFRWGELRALGQTLEPEWLEAPPKDARQQLRRLAQAEDWSALLEAAEMEMAQPWGRAWLDLQRYTLLSCDALGEPYLRVAHSVVGQIRLLLAGFPDLLESALTDDTPVANAQTREFFAQRGCLPGAAEIRPAPSAPLLDDTGMIEDALRRGKADLALNLVSRRLAAETSGRGRFERRVQLARILVATGKLPAALPLLRELCAEIESRRLVDWEAAATVVEPLILLYGCLRLEGDAPERERIYAQICRLDPVRAFELS